MTVIPIACALALLAAYTTAGAQPRSVAIVAESASAIRNPRVFVARHDPLTQAGDVVAQRVADLNGQTELWSAARALDRHTDAALVERLILTTDPQNLGVSLQWAALTPSMRSLLITHGMDEARLSYWRGARGAQAGAGMRPRASRLGEILNSNLWYVGRRANADAPREAMVFAGANDGMLHGFDVEDGTEKIAYVPRGLLPRLSALTRTGSVPALYVDGPVFAGDALVGDNGGNRTILIGALGAGGKGFYGLDISDAQGFSPARAAATVVLDLTASADVDLGQIFSPPVVDEADPNRTRQIVQLNNRRWAAVMGNGYFSTSGQPVLLIQYLDGAHEMHKLSPCRSGRPCAFAGSNGLSAPRLIDVNGDGMVDIAYAGDLQGHLWKFDLSSRSPEGAPDDSWRIAFAGQPFFIARDANGNRQPITTAPFWMPHPRGGVMLVIGTGRHLQRSDTASTAPQSLYGLHDNSAMTSVAGQVRIAHGTAIHTVSATSARPTTLVQQRYGDARIEQGITYHDVSGAAVAYESQDRGWWLDLPYAGQRVLHNPRGFEGQKVLVQSVVPSNTGRAPWNAGSAYLSVFNVFTGHAPSQPAFASAEATLPDHSGGLASIASGPTLVFRQPGRTQLVFPDQRSQILRNATTSGARTGWRERP